MALLFELAFGELANITIKFESIYTECLIDDKFDYIYSLPNFGYKPDEIGRTFISRESDGIAIQNMLDHLSDSGTLEIIVPAKLTFAGMEYSELRAYINNNFNLNSIHILPEETFKPVASIKTYLFNISRHRQESIEIGTLELISNNFRLTDNKVIPNKDFMAYEDWRIELLLAEDNENIQKFKTSNITKVKLKEVAEVFRGKSILKKDTSLGNIRVLNISNIDNGEIDYINMDTISEEERKIKRYELISGDVILSCRGTAIKSAVFTNQESIIIASANLIVIRPVREILGEYIKIFFESPIGIAIIKSFQRGTTIMNINHSDIMEMEIPLLSIAVQKEMIEEYHKEQKIYKQAINEAENRWIHIKNNIYNKLI